MIKKIFAELNARGLEVVKDLDAETDVDGYLRDCEAFCAGTFVMALTGLIVMGPKKWFSMIYSKKGFVVGTLLGFCAVAWLLLNNKKPVTEEKTEDVE